MNKSILFVLAFFTSAIFAQTTTFNTNGTGATGSIQQYIINGCTSEIEIEGYGAQGGNTNGGLGARMRGRFSVAAGDTIFIVVGQQGTINQCGGINASSGGGGGSFVWKGTGPGRVLLLVAGGGGGGNMNWSGSCIDGIAAVTTNDGTQGNGPTSALGGTGGNGGFGNAPSGTGSGGAGWLTSGENSTWGSGCTGGLTYPLFTGGDGAVAFSSPGEGVGGYGGGGGAVCGNGGGGGYSGGGGGEGSSCRAGGGGGGSYNVGTSQSNTAGIQTGNGLVTITVTSSLGSGNTLSASITPNDTVCVGTMVTASGINGTSYAWNNGVVNGVPFMASSSSTYVLSAIDTAGCLDTFAIQLHVNSLPNILSNVSSNDTVCSGTTVTLFGSGGLSYTWNNSVVNNVPFIINTSGNYIVNGTDNNGCSNTDTLNMVVNTNPTILSNVLPNDTVCTGTTVTLFGSGGLSYTWNNSVINNVPFIINTSGNYIVNGTDNNGCNNADTLNMVVNTNPTVSLGADIIQSNPPAILDAGIGFTGYLWNTSAITQTISVTTNGTYNVTVTNANGCTDSDTIQVFFTAGLEDTDISSANVVIYPNPSDGIFNLSVSNIDAEKLTIKIIDINGKIILTQNLGKVEGHFMKEFDLSNLSDGSYILVFEADGKESFIRLLKQ